MAQTRKSTKKTSTKQKASSTKKKSTAKKAAGASASKGKSPASPKANQKASPEADPKASPKKVSKTTSKKATSKKATSKKATSKKATSKTATSTKKTTAKRATSRSGKATVDLPELNLVRGLADVLESYGLEELTYDSPDVTVTLKRPRLTAAEVSAVAVPAVNPATHPVNVPAVNAAPMLIASPPPAPPPDPDKFLERSGAETDEEHQVIKSPFVGTFYRRPSPDTEPYVTLGMRVSKGQVLCIIEAMKLMNEIECDVSGRVADILVEDAQPVEYGQSLFKITYS